MVTHFVPSPGSNRVSRRSNPGAYLILRPDHRGEDSWRPWGRLEAWRERESGGGLGCKFELMADGGGLSQSQLSEPKRVASLLSSVVLSSQALLYPTLLLQVPFVAMETLVSARRLTCLTVAL